MTTPIWERSIFVHTQYSRAFDYGQRSLRSCPPFCDIFVDFSPLLLFSPALEVAWTAGSILFLAAIHLNLQTL